jgi:hypothetical protein
MKKVICVLSVLWLCAVFSNCSGFSNPVQGKTFVIEKTGAMFEGLYSTSELEFQKEVFHFRSPLVNFTGLYQIRDNYIFVDEGGKNAMTFKIINPNKIELVVETSLLDNFIFVAK